MKRILLFVLLLTNYCVFGQFGSCRDIGLRIGYNDINETIGIANNSLTPTDNFRLSPNSVQSDDYFPFKFCPGASLYLQGEVQYSYFQMTQATYEWSGPDGRKSNEPTFELKKINQNTAGNYILKMTISREGCPDTTVTQVRRIELTTPVIQVQDEIICKGGDIQLEAKNDYAYAPDSHFEKSKKVFSWSGPNGFTSTESNPVIKNIKESGIYTVTITFSDFCTGTAQTTAKVTTSEKSLITANYASACLGGQTSLKAYPTVSGATGRFIWKGPNGFIKEGNEIILNNLQEKDAGSYQLIAHFTGGCTNSDSSYTSLDIISPMPRFDFIDEFCEGGIMRFPSKNTFGSPYFNGQSTITYSWTGPDGFQSDEEVPIIENFKKEQSGIYELELTFTGACNAKAKRNFSVKPVEKPFISINKYVINYSSNHQEIIMYAEPYYYLNNYIWSGPNNFSSTSYNTTIKNFDAKKAGIYSVSVTLPGCKEPSTASINLKPDTVAKILTVQTVTSGTLCKGSTINITASTTPYDGNTTYLWHGPNGFKAEGAQVEIKNISESSDGIYTVIASNSYGESYDTTSVKAIKIPHFSLPDTLKICEGGSMSLYPDSPFRQYRDNTKLKYEWTGPNNFNSSDKEIWFKNFNKSQQGEYELKVTLTEGCEGIVSTKFNVIESPPEVNWSIDRLCNDKIEVTPKSNMFSYNVSRKLKIFDSNNNEVSNPIIPNASSDIYTLDLSLTGGCNAKIQKQINVKDIEPFHIQLPEVIKVCVNNPLAIEAKIMNSISIITNTYYSYNSPNTLLFSTWTGPNDFTATHNSFYIPSIKKADAGIYKITANFIGECQGTYEAETEIVIDSERPRVDFNLTQNENLITLKNTTLSDNSSTFFWDFGNGQNSNLAAPDTIAYTNPGTYTINLTASNACGTASNFRKITITKEEVEEENPEEEEPEEENPILSTENPTELLSFTVSPNPSAGMVEISNPNKLDVQLSVHTIDGKLLDSFSMNHDKHIIKYDFSTYAAGVYLIKCVQKNGQVRTRKIVIHK